jgi:hypothetical protein
MKSRAKKFIEQMLESVPLDKYTQALKKFGFMEPDRGLYSPGPYIQYIQNPKERMRKDLGAVIVTRQRGLFGSKSVPIVTNWVHVFGSVDDPQQRSGTVLNDLIMSLENI